MAQLRSNSQETRTVNDHCLGLILLASDALHVARVLARQVGRRSQQLDRSVLGEPAAAWDGVVGIDSVAESLHDTTAAQLHDPLVDRCRILVQKPLDHQHLVFPLVKRIYAIKDDELFCPVLQSIWHIQCLDLDASSTPVCQPDQRVIEGRAWASETSVQTQRQKELISASGCRDAIAARFASDTCPFLIPDLGC